MNSKGRILEQPEPQDASYTREHIITSPSEKDILIRRAAGFIGVSSILDMEPALPNRETYIEVIHSRLLQFISTRRVQLRAGMLPFVEVPANTLVEVLNPLGATLVIQQMPEVLICDPIGAYRNGVVSFIDGPSQIGPWIEPPLRWAEETSIGRYILTSVTISAGAFNFQIEGRTGSPAFNTIIIPLTPLTPLVVGDNMIESDTLEKWPKQRRLRLFPVGLGVGTAKIIQIWNARIVDPEGHQPGSCTRVRYYTDAKAILRENTFDFVDSGPNIT